jgi:threonine aldolase
VFYIGGTKIGALLGEAVVITNPSLLKHFVPLVKQHGALMAKGRLLGVQFEALFTDGLYESISRNVVRLAIKLRDGFMSAGYPPVVDSPTNQQFFTLPNSLIERLGKDASFEMWGPAGETESTVRFVTGWSTTDEDIDALFSALSTASDSL